MRRQLAEKNRMSANPQIKMAMTPIPGSVAESQQISLMLLLTGLSRHRNSGIIAMTIVNNRQNHNVPIHIGNQSNQKTWPAFATSTGDAWRAIFMLNAISRRSSIRLYACMTTPKAPKWLPGAQQEGQVLKAGNCLTYDISFRAG